MTVHVQKLGDVDYFEYDDSNVEKLVDAKGVYEIARGAKLHFPRSTVGEHGTRVLLVQAHLIFRPNVLRVEPSDDPDLTVTSVLKNARLAFLSKPVKASEFETSSRIDQLAFRTNFDTMVPADVYEVAFRGKPGTPLRCWFVGDAPTPTCFIEDAPT